MSQTKPVRVPSTPPNRFSPIVNEPNVGYSGSTCWSWLPSQTVTQSRLMACLAIPTRSSLSLSKDLPIRTAISSRYASSSMSRTLRLFIGGSAEKEGCSTRSNAAGWICGGNDELKVGPLCWSNGAGCIRLRFIGGGGGGIGFVVSAEELSCHLTHTFSSRHGRPSSLSPREDSASQTSRRIPVGMSQMKVS